MSSIMPVADSIDAAATVFDNTMYSAGNTARPMQRVINQINQASSFSSNGFGRTENMTLPSGNLLSSVIVTVKLDRASLVANTFLEKGWMFKLIQNLEFRYGNSDWRSYTGENLLIKNVADCESGEKIDAMLNLAGDLYNGDVSPGTYPNGVTGSVVIYLPNSNMSASKMVPFDTSILSSPVSLRIGIKKASDFFTYASADAAAVLPLLPTSMTSAYVTVKNGILVDGPSDSIRQLVSLTGRNRYVYPFMLPTPFISDSFLGRPFTDPAKMRNSVRLNDLQNGSLHSIDIFLERMTFDSTPSATLTNSARSELIYYPMTNIRLSYASRPVYETADDTSELFNLVEYTASTKYDTSSPAYVTAVHGGGVFTVNSITSSWLHVPISQFNERHFMFGSLIQDGVNVVQNALLLEFNVPENSSLGLGGVAPLTPPYFRVRCNYNYQCSVEVAGSNTTIEFNPPTLTVPINAGLPNINI